METPFLSPAITRSALPQTGMGVADATKTKLREKAQEFEAFYIRQFISLTRPDLSDDPIFGGGYGEQAFSDLMDEHIGKAISQRGGFGLADRVYAELLALQERNSN